MQDPQTKESNLNKVTIYVVKGKDQKGSFVVHRKFTEFYAVMEVLNQFHTGYDYSLARMLYP